MAKITKKQTIKKTTAKAKATAKKTQTSAKSGAKKTTPRTSLKTPKKAPARAQKAPSPRTRTTAKPELVQAKLTPIKAKAVIVSKGTRRPPLTPSIPHQVIDEVISDLINVKNNLDAYAAHLRALDRKCLNKIGNKREGFAQRAYRIAMDNPEFLPNYLDPERYTEDYDHFMILQTAIVLETQVHELLKNINIECMDYFYTDALDFYAAVREAAKRRVDAAESLYEELKTSFDRKKGENAPETEKQQLRKAKGIITGKIDGKIEAVNIKPKATGGVHKVIDEEFSDFKSADTARFKETEEGDIEE